ncbi:hypothetical protein [Mangrovibacterium sp.]|uniref:hypothetical protein n=1 Tax=Mangrovibacterium sp. TaxID=1961364 RepID=UPI00356A329C
MSHYIKVGNLKLDQDLMDVICPAAGFTPENICTVENGYIPNPNVPFVAPITVVDIDVPPETIIFIMDSTLMSIFNKMTVSINASSALKYTFYDSDENLLGDVTSSSTSTHYASIAIPPSPTQFVKMVISIVTAGRYFTKLVSSASSSAFQVGTIAMYANTPNMKELYGAFQYYKSIKEVKFYCTLNELTTMELMFSNSSIEQFTFDISLPKLSTIKSMFYISDLWEITFSTGFSAPLLTTVYGTFRNTKLKSASIPIINSVLDCTFCFYQNSLLESLVIGGFPNATNVQGFIAESPRLLSFNLPEMLLNANFDSFANKCYGLKILKFNGETKGFAGKPKVITDCYSLDELEWPRATDSPTSVIAGNNMSIKKIRLPDYVIGNAASIFVNYFWKISGNNALEYISGDYEWSTGISGSFYMVASDYPNIKEIAIPKFKVASIQLGVNIYNKLNKLTNIAFDWSHTSWTTGGSTILIYAALTTGCLNDIYTELPTVSGATYTLDVSSNDGYAGSDPSIATAKGWTVL